MRAGVLLNLALTALTAIAAVTALEVDPTASQCEVKFNAGCTDCSADRCTATAEGYFLRADAALNNAIASARCDAHYGANCRSCDPAVGCTALVSEDIGILCRTRPVQGTYCLQINSKCKTCDCYNNYPRCLATFDVNSYVDKATQTTKTCKEGYSVGCNNCNSDRCTVAENGYTLVPGSPVPVPCAQKYNEFCRSCNATQCTAVTSGAYAINPEGMPVPCSEITGEGTNTCQLVTVQDPATGSNIRVWQCSSSVKGYYCGVTSDARRSLDAVVKRSRKCPMPNCAACDATGSCTEADKDFCLTKAGAAVLKQTIVGTTGTVDPWAQVINENEFFLVPSTGGHPNPPTCTFDILYKRPFCFRINSDNTDDSKYGEYVPDLKAQYKIQFDATGLKIDGEDVKDIYVKFFHHRCNSPWQKLEFSDGTPNDKVVPMCKSVDNCEGAACWSTPPKVAFGYQPAGHHQVVMLPQEACPETTTPNNIHDKEEVCDPSVGTGTIAPSTPIRRAAISGSNGNGNKPSDQVVGVVEADLSKCVNPHKPLGNGACKCAQGFEWDKDIDHCVPVGSPKCKTSADAEYYCGTGSLGCFDPPGKPGQIACICPAESVKIANASSAAIGPACTIVAADYDFECEPHGRGIQWTRPEGMVSWGNYNDLTWWVDNKLMTGPANGQQGYVLTVDQASQELQYDLEAFQVMWGIAAKNGGDNNLNNKNGPLCWDGNSQKACFCHRTCAAGTGPNGYFYHRVPAALDDAHYVAVGVLGTDLCCDANGKCPGEENPPVPVRPNVQMWATETCCQENRHNNGNGCAAQNCWGDPHINTADGTYFDAYHRDGVFRVMDYVVYDRETQTHQVVTVDGQTTSSGQTYMKWVAITVDGHQANYTFGLSGTSEGIWEADGEQRNVIVEGGDMYVSDAEGNVIFVVSYHAGRREHSIRLARDPHMTLYIRNQNREMRTGFITPNVNARYEWIASAGMNGLVLPKPFEGLLDIERRRLRADDLVDREKWNAFVAHCLTVQGQKCDTTPLTAISNPVVFYQNQPVAPADSAFLGWAGIEAYGYDKIFNAGTSWNLKTVGHQRCFVNEFVLQWAHEIPHDPTLIFSAEHLKQCAEARSPAIDAFYAQFPGYVALPPLETAVRRQASNGNGNANGNGKKPGNQTPPGQNKPDKKNKEFKNVPGHLRKAAEKGVRTLTSFENCPVTAEGKFECADVYYVGDEVVTIIQATSEARVQNWGASGPDTPVLESSIRPIFGNTATVMDVDGNVKAEVPVNPAELPKTREVSICGDDGVARKVPHEMVDNALSQLVAHFTNILNDSDRRRAVESDPDVNFALVQAQNDCIKDVMQHIKIHGHVDDAASHCSSL